MSGTRRSLIVLAALVAVAAGAPHLAPYDPARQFTGYPYAPPMAPHVLGDHGFRLPFAHPLHLVDPLERRYEIDYASTITFADPEPWFLLGSDRLGRDVWSRLLAGAPLSLGVALTATLAALLIGAAIGAWAGYGGGAIDAVLMRLADFVLILPGLYVLLAMRGALPLVLSPGQVFAVLTAIMALIGWPSTARGVRGIFLVEGRQEYAEAAKALGASPGRIVVRHLLPSAAGFLGTQATLLVPALLMAEATLSFVGLGFAPPAPSWGVMLQDASVVQTAADAPWLLSPAAAIVATVFLVHTAVRDYGIDPHTHSTL